MPALTQLLILTAQDESCTPVNPAGVDAMSNYLNTALATNQQASDLALAQIRAATPAPPDFLHSMYQSVCKRAAKGVGGWVERTFVKGGRGGFAYMFALGAELAVCPKLVGSLLD